MYVPLRQMQKHNLAIFGVMIVLVTLHFPLGVEGVDGQLAHQTL